MSPVMWPRMRDDYEPGSADPGQSLVKSSDQDAWEPGAEPGGGGGGGGSALDATGQPSGHVPTAQGDDTWAWAAQSGGGGGAVDTVQRVASATGTVALSSDLTHHLTLTGDATLQLPAAPEGAVAHSIVIDQGSTGGRSVTWPDTVGWPGDAAPTLDTTPLTRSVVVLLTLDGGLTWTGAPVGTGIIPPAAPPVPEAPDAPTALSAVGDEDSISLSWAAPGNGGSPITGYRVYRGTTSGSLSLLTTETGLTHDDTSAAPSTTYYYQVSAVNAVGEGPRSTEASGKRVAAPALVVADNFNRADTPHGDAGDNPGVTSTGAVPWEASAIHTWAVLSNGMASPYGGDNQAAVVQTGHSDVAVECVIRTKKNYDGLAVRYLNDDNFFRIGWTSTGVFAYRREAGAIAHVHHEGAVTGGTPQGATFRVEASGSAWTVKVNGTTVLTFTDAFQSTATKHGVCKSGTLPDPRWDDFKVYSL